jgi:hypothetical protein
MEQQQNGCSLVHRMQSLPLFPFFTKLHCGTHQENLLKNCQGIRWMQFPAGTLIIVNTECTQPLLFE